MVWISLALIIEPFPLHCGSECLLPRHASDYLAILGKQKNRCFDAFFNFIRTALYYLLLCLVYFNELTFLLKVLSLNWFIRWACFHPLFGSKAFLNIQTLQIFSRNITKRNPKAKIDAVTQAQTIWVECQKHIKLKVN